MARDNRQIYEERRQQIIAGALKVFSTKGFTQATNKDVAAAAGINSPGLIYHYFQDKADLLRAVIDRYAPPIQLVARADEMMQLPPVEALTQLGLAYLRLIDDPNLSAAMKLMMGEALRDPEFAGVVSEIGALRILRFLTIYLQRQMDEGVLRKADPAIAARCFIGPLILRFMTRNVLRLPEAADVAPAAFVAAHVDLFLNGLQAKV